MYDSTEEYKRKIISKDVTIELRSYNLKKCQPTWRGYLGYRFALLMGHEADDGENNKPGEHWGAAVYTGNDQGVTAKKNEWVANIFCCSRVTENIHLYS